ncbi:lipopolysaccharide biosynthesis protein [Methylobacterium durans]|uniref:Lipopolysaccharide biosynthesis protein n=1 Tax=Methylobacterium durans TaxID=2202825 RepID=A0A2U8WF93_9HYPH|nr:GNVR domain-containing protein [Methylobacterium durans]AWN44699.1 lipopolysaccharide biosynthesis protein [Methylobacterium durans]
MSQVGGVLRRSWLWIALPTIAAGAAAVAFVQVVPPRYTGEAKLLLESREAGFARTAQERTDQPQPIDEQAVASQAQVVMSRDLAREAIRRLKLVGNPEFDPSVDGLGPVQRALMLVGLAQNPLERPSEDRVLDAYFERLLVYPAGKSRILSVEFRSKDPALAAQGANTISELYIASLEAAKVDTARYASTWLGGNIETLRSRVAEAEAKVEAFRAKNGLVAAGGIAGQPLSGQQLAELSSQLSHARTLKADLDGRVKLIREMIKDGRAFEIPDVANNDLIRRVVESRITLRAQLALESRTLLPAHPRIKELTAQVADLDGQIKSAAERIGRTLENDAKIAGARVESLQATVEGQRDVVVKGNSSEVQLRALEREAKAQREQLESYLSRYREAAARDAESASPADVRIVSRAVVPELPSFPKKLPIVGLAMLFAFLFSAGAVIARRLLANPGGAPPAEAGRSDGSEAAATRPEPARFTFPEAAPPASWPPLAQATVGPAPASGPDKPTHPRAETGAPFDLGLLIDRLGAQARGEGGRTILVVETETAMRGSGRRAPKGLAETLADTLAGGARVLAVDLDGPASGPDEPGLTDLVAGDAAFLDVIQPVPGSRLHRVAHGFVEGEVLLEEPQALAISLDAMAEAYDWVVCSQRFRPGEASRALLAEVAGRMDSVVIASNASADDVDLVALYGIAEDAGAGQVLVAQDKVATAAEALDHDMPLRLSAA